MHITVKALKKRISAAKGEIPADLVLKGGRVVNVFSGEILKRDVAIYDGVIVGVGSGYQGKEEKDFAGKWIIPGLIDGHFHIESSMLLPRHLAVALLIHGTTTLVADPHEIANVMGLPGIRLMLRESLNIPFDIFFMAPSCVPATHLETSGATLTASDLSTFKGEPRILGLAEMMNYPGVLMGDEAVLEKIVYFSDQMIDGHCPSLSDHDLQAYITAGIRSDHEATTLREAHEKMENGMMLMIREGTSAKDLEKLLPLINDKNSRRCCFVSDDLHAEDIQQRGHLDFMVKEAIRLGLDPVIAVQLVTLNPAEYFSLRDRGAIAPGYRADIVILDNLKHFEVTSVYKEGRLVVGHGALVDSSVAWQKMTSIESKPLNIAPLSLESLRIPFSENKARVIDLVPGQLITHERHEHVKSNDGFVMSDIESDILKLCVVERHHASGCIGLGLVRGFGLNRGAMASSVAHDSHNVIAVGVSDEEILIAVEAVKFMGGGLAVVCDKEVLAKTPLPMAGLMSTEPLEALVRQLRSVKRAAAKLGCVLEDPFMMLSFLALPVIPALKLTDKGLVDVNKFEIVPLFL
jgi:adenine deaminase